MPMPIPSFLPKKRLTNSTTSINDSIMKKHFKTFAKGVLFGGVVGAAVALFNSPKKGDEIRKDAKKIFDTLIKEGKRLQKQAHPLMKKVEHTAQRTLKQGKKIAKDIQKHIKK